VLGRGEQDYIPPSILLRVDEIIALLSSLRSPRFPAHHFKPMTGASAPPDTSDVGLLDYRRAIVDIFFALHSNILQSPSSGRLWRTTRAMSDKSCSNDLTELRLGTGMMGIGKA
jgi:hypothetical protein